MKLRYDVVLHTELGDKRGHLDLQIKENKICGLFKILAGQEDVRGKLDNEGGCLLYGKIVTAMHIYDFTACGLLAEENINLEMKIGSDVFSLSGKAVKQEALIK